MADPVVTITNGVPVSGTGTITTLGQTLVDGANATLGVTTGAAVTTSTTGTIQQYLRGLVSLAVSGVTVLSHAVTNAGTFAVQVTSTVSTAVTNAGTFAVQAVLGAETTKVIGTVRNQGNVGGVYDGATGASVPANVLYVGVNNSGNLAGLYGDSTNGLWVNIKSGAGSGGTALTDEAAFTQGSTSITPIGGIYKTSYTALSSGHAGVLSLSAIGEANTLGKIWDGTNTAAVKAASTVPLATDPALVVAISPNSINQNGQVSSSLSAPVVPANDYVPPVYALPANFVSGAITSAMTGTTSTSLVAAPGAGLHNYITTIVVSNSHATVGTDVIIQDGSGGTTLLTIPAAAAYGGGVIPLPTPLRQPTANTALYCANVTTGSSTKVSAVGYKGA